MKEVFFNVEGAEDIVIIIRIHTFSSKQGSGAQPVT
jgi:hypothetical protein